MLCFSSSFASIHTYSTNSSDATLGGYLPKCSSNIQIFPTLPEQARSVGEIQAGAKQSRASKSRAQSSRTSQVSSGFSMTYIVSFAKRRSPKTYLATTPLTCSPPPNRRFQLKSLRLKLVTVHHVASAHRLFFMLRSTKSQGIQWF